MKIFISGFILLIALGFSNRVTQILVGRYVHTTGHSRSNSKYLAALGVHATYIVFDFSPWENFGFGGLLIGEI